MHAVFSSVFCQVLYQGVRWCKTFLPFACHLCMPPLYATFLLNCYLRGVYSTSDDPDIKCKSYKAMMGYALPFT